MIATGHPLAAAAARHALAEGGSAVDAAVAADAVLGVVEPMATGIGGDLLAMIVEPDGQAVAYNGTGRAPASLSAERVAQMPGGRIPERHPWSVTVPGAVCGWHDLHQRYGRLEWPRLLRDAITLARTGFAVAPVAAREWKLFEPVLKADPTAAALYRHGRVPAAGEVFANPELAEFLARIARDGYRAFYDGSAAEAMAAAVRARGGLLGADDLAAHAGNFCVPLRGEFCGVTVLECPPNTHGCAVIDALLSLEAFAREEGTPQAVAALVEATGRALQTASKTVADPSGNTVCTVIVDRDGLAITLMSSIFKRFGSAIAVPGLGFVLQNRGFGFSAPGHPNGPAGGKRPYHTVIPAACLREGRFHAGLGVVGGLMQPQGQVQLLTRLFAWGEPLREAIAAPRWRLEGGRALALETGFPADAAALLRERGFGEPAAGEGDLAGRSDFGGAQVVLRLPDGSLAGASDPRKDGVALAD